MKVTRRNDVFQYTPSEVTGGVRALFGFDSVVYCRNDSDLPEKKPHVRDIITVVAKERKYENIENFQDLFYFTSNKPKNENCKPKQKPLIHFTIKVLLKVVAFS